MSIRTLALITVLGAAVGSHAFGHGDVAPQPVDTDALPDIGEEWLEENPYRDADPAVWQAALEIGASGYNQNCARCHGLEAISGGLAPDLRYLEANWDGDEWYVERFRHGYTQNGITKMPAFGDLLGQKAAWAIRTYVETRPDDGAVEPYSDRLKEIRDTLADAAAKVEAGATTYDSLAADIDGMKEEMLAVSREIVTGSGAPVADSVASRAVAVLDGSDGSLKKAAEVLTIGLSAAQ